ncbi:MAG TPA: DUF1003 domain-containing protein [Microbacteriaceae bacterium]|nr:DUF1003 domain-containing protein [Microbacteriaceae bacterium]
MPRTDRRAPARIDTPKGIRSQRAVAPSRDRFGHFTESIARWMGTPWFIFGLTVFVLIWMLWNTGAPEGWRFDSAAIGFTALTLILSLQASYAAPLILLAQNRQDDRDRVAMEQDRQRSERNLEDTEYLAREIVALRLGLEDIATKDFVRQELRAMLAELEQQREAAAGVAPAGAEPSPLPERTEPSPLPERSEPSPLPERAKRVEGA